MSISLAAIDDHKHHHNATNDKLTLQYSSKQSMGSTEPNVIVWYIDKNLTIENVWISMLINVLTYSTSDNCIY